MPTIQTTTMPTIRFDDTAGPDMLNVPLDALLRSRLLVQANSGGGKSRVLRALLEQTHGRVLQLVLDPEGEFSTLRERFNFVLAGKDGDVPAHPKIARVLCRRLVETNASAVIDLYDLSMTERREFVKLFLTELMALPRALWKPALIVLDEGHLFAPERGSGEAQSLEAVIALCTQGRKRGFCSVIATQRISKLHKDVAAELLNKMIGRTGLDVDMKRAGDELGMDKEHRQALRELSPGEFFAFGPAMGGHVQRVRSGAVLTTHPDSNSLGVIAPPANASVQALVAQIGDLPKLAVQEQDERAALEQQVRDLQKRVRELVSLRMNQPAVVDDAKLRAEYERGVKVGHVHGSEATRRHAQRVVDAIRQRVVRYVQDFGEALEGELSRLDDLALLAKPEPDEPVTVGTHANRLYAEAAAKATPDAMPLPKPKPAAPVSRRVSETTTTTGTAKISSTMRRMLAVLVTLDALGVEWPEKRTMAGWSGVSHTTGTFSNQLRGLRDAGCIEVDGQSLRITEVGRMFADPAPSITTLAQLHEVWASKFSATVARMFVALLELSGPRCTPVRKADLAAAVGVSHTTGTFSNQLRELRTPGVIEDVNREAIRLTALVWPEGLR